MQVIRVIQDLGDWPTMEWRKAQASNPSGNCVEFTIHSGQFLIRHSKEPSGPALVFDVAEWAAFISGVKNGEFEVE